MGKNDFTACMDNSLKKLVFLILLLERDSKI